MKNMILLDINLRLFDGAAAVAGTGGEGGTASPAPAEADTPDGKARAANGRRAKENLYSNVVFGKQNVAGAEQENGSDSENGGEGKSDASSGAGTEQTVQEQKRKAYLDLIHGEYRDQYLEDTQRMMQEQMRNNATMENRLNEQKAIMDLLTQRYGVENGDLKALHQALENDTAYWEKAADEAGMPVEQFKQQKKWERDSAELEKLKRQQQSEQEARQLIDRLRNGEAEVKKIYPEFDLKTELKNRDFYALLNVGIPMQMAYELRHMDEIKAAAARNAAQATGQQMTARMKSKAARPAENGTSSKNPVVVKSDVTKLSREDRAEIARRVAHGESIFF